MPDRFPFIYRSATGFFRRLYFPTHGGIKVLHAERVPTEGGLIVVSNHMSHLDAPAMAVTFRNRRLRAMAKEELWKNKFFGKLIEGIGAFPVKRGEADSESMRKCIELLKSGEAVIVFAEGTRGNGRDLQALEPGVALLAKKANVPVLPVGICGTQFVMPNGDANPKQKRQVVVVTGEPIRFEDVAGAGRDGREKFLQALRERVTALTVEGGVPLKLD